MYRKNIAAMFTTVALLFLASCAKEGPTGPTGNTGPSLSGSISGHLKLYDKYGSIVVAGLNKANLYINSGGAAIQPDATGYYAYSNLLTGIFSITVSDSGYAGTVKSNIQLVTGALNVDLKLSAIPDSFINTLTTYHNAGSTNDSLSLNFTQDGRIRYAIIFASTTSAVSNANYLWSKVISVAGSTPVVAFNVPGQDLTDAGFVSGQKVYFAAYSYVVNDASVYEDFTTGQNVYNAVNAHPVIDSTYVP